MKRKVTFMFFCLALLLVVSTGAWGSVVFSINSGGGQYTDASGVVYQADTDYSGGYPASTTAAITGTADPALYQSERYGNFSYNIPLANGNYTVTLKFAEIYWTAAGHRIFDVSMQGTQVISNLDIFALAGKDGAYDVSIPVSVTNGTLNIAFTSVADYAKISAIKVTTASSGTSPDTTPPTVPAGLSTTVVSSSQINLSWSASTDPVVSGQVTSGLAGYRVYRNGALIGSTATTTYSDSLLTASTTYSYTVSAYDMAGNESAQSGAVSATTLSSGSQPPTTVFAVNAGGGQYTDASGVVYQTDTDNSGGYPASTAAAITGTADPALYQSERYGNFSYNIPLANGNYTVTLKFAEIYWTAAGHRIFDVSMQGTQVISNLDIFALAGKDGAYDVSIPVSVTNGTLNIAFTSVADYAKISAIKVTTASSGTSPDTTPPTVPAGLSTTVVSSSQINLSWSASTDPVVSGQVTSGLAGYKVYRNGALIGSTATSTYSDSLLTASTTYSYTVSAYDMAGNESAQSGAVSATTLSSGSQPPAIVFAVNAGGGQYTDTSGVFYQADMDYSGGTAASTTAAITGTADPTLYQSERYGNFSYNIPLANGNYTVTLKFAEIYWNAAGQRIFNVSMQGTQVISNLDIYAKAGKDGAYDVSVPVSVTNGVMNITFTSLRDYAKVSAIELTWIQSPGGGNPVTTPTIPTSLKATIISPSQIDLTWSASTDKLGIAGYSVYRNGTKITSVTGTSYSDTGLFSSSAYTYSVSAYDSACNTSDTSAPVSVTTPAGQITYISNFPWVGTPVNGSGPVEIDMSNGGQAAGDGHSITLNGVTYAKGLGVAASSDITYSLGGQYSRFVSDIGIDDEVGNSGSVIFQVLADGAKIYDSGIITGGSPTQRVDVNVTGVKQLELVVNPGNGLTNDNADWAGAYLYSGTTNSYTLTVVNNGTGSGTVATSPAGTTFTGGTPVTLTATSGPGSIFAGWSGGGCGGPLNTYTEYALSDPSWTFVNASYYPETLLLQESSSNGLHGSYLSSSYPSDMTAFTAEVYPSGRNWVSVGGNGYIYFDIQAGVAGVSSNIAASGIKSLPGGWYEISVAPASNADGDAYITLAEENNGTSYQGDGTSGVLIRNPRFVRFREGKSAPQALSSSPEQIAEPGYKYRGGVALGDSFTVNANYTREVNNTSEYLLIVDKGISGQTLPQIVGRFSSDAMPFSPSFVLLMGGINDMAAASSDPNPEMQAQVQAFVSNCNSAYAIPVLATLPPVEGNTMWTPAVQGWINTYNAWIRNYASANGYALLDLVNILSTDGLRLNPEYDSGDHEHPNIVGYNVIGDNIVTLLDGIPAISSSCIVPINSNMNITATFNLVP